MHTDFPSYYFLVDRCPAYGSFIEALSKAALSRQWTTPKKFLGIPLTNALRAALDCSRWERHGGEPLNYYCMLWSPHWLLVRPQCFRNAVKFVLEAIHDAKMSLDPRQLLAGINEPYGDFTVQEVKVASQSWIVACSLH